MPEGPLINEPLELTGSEYENIALFVNVTEFPEDPKNQTKGAVFPGAIEKVPVVLLTAKME